MAARPPYKPPPAVLRTSRAASPINIESGIRRLAVPSTKTQIKRSGKTAVRKATLRSGLAKEARIRRVKGLIQTHGVEKAIKIAGAHPLHDATGKIHGPTGARLTPTPPKPHVPKPFKMERAHFSPIKPRKFKDIHVGVAPGRDLFGKGKKLI